MCFGQLYFKKAVHLKTLLIFLSLAPSLGTAHAEPAKPRPIPPIIYSCKALAALDHQNRPIEEKGLPKGAKIELAVSNDNDSPARATRLEVNGKECQIIGQSLIGAPVIDTMIEGREARIVFPEQDDLFFGVYFKDQDINVWMTDCTVDGNPLY